MFAQQFDATGKGGVITAAIDWLARNPKLPAILLNSSIDGSRPPDDSTYKDGCGLGLIQKPFSK
jgi:hypothetical protein